MSAGRSKRKSRPIGVGIVGLGYMGRTHLAAYRAAARAGFANRVVALCDRERAGLGRRRGGNLVDAGGDLLRGKAAPAFHRDAEALFADPEVELVSLCTPTDTHVALALAALRAGKHVLLEKPVALRARDAARIAEAARSARRRCMPAMCMRFWPGWDWLKERIDAGTFGRVESAVFRQLAAPPSWSRGFYGDAERSGGALFDLHVHDADFVRHCFGAPSAVTSAGSLDHVTTLYRYERGPAHVVAEGGWDHTPGFPFSMGYTVVFERATARYDLASDPPLTLARAGKVVPVALGPGTGYDGEVRHLLGVLAGGGRPRATIDEAVPLLAMLAAERRSLAMGRPQRLTRD